MVLKLIHSNPLPEEDRATINQWLLHGGQEQSSDQQQLDMEAWLQADPARRQQARALDDIWNDAAFTDALRQHESELTQRQKSHTVHWYGATAAALVMGLAALLYSASGPQPQSFTTAQQQTSQQTLEDGSQLAISAASQLLVTYSPQERHIDLLQGEASFSVSKDPSRPFVVQTRHARLKALGTVFNVDQRRGMTELTVLEGRVEITPAQASNRRLVLTAGQRVRIRAQGAGQTESFDPVDYRGWQQGVLQADNMPLAELIDELNRYSPIPIRLADELNTLAVSGTFHLRDTRKNIQLLAAVHQLTWQEENHTITLAR
ncbi:MAG: FecR domain-containing protein [Pseudomonadota bacterium]|nr:FecR domain-containing protein [Pseudomonadota bacterium]